MHDAPAPVPVYDSHRRGNERLYDANVTSVRAMVGPVEQRCWIEREQGIQMTSPPGPTVTVNEYGEPRA